LPPAQENVTYFAAGSVVSESFTGVLWWDLVNQPPVGGIVTDPTIKNDILHKVIIVTGTDCYQSVFGAGEINPFFGGNQIISLLQASGYLRFPSTSVTEARPVRVTPGKSECSIRSLK
jgi:hypothetical protein